MYSQVVSHKDMDFNQIIGIIGQLATWITVLLVFLTLREMEKQRKASQKPELIIPMLPIFGYFRDWNNIFVPTEWQNNESKAGEALSKQQPVIRIYNIGSGAAKNITLKWYFDLDITLKEIQEYCYHNSIPIVVKVENDFGSPGFPGVLHGFDADTCKDGFAFPHQRAMLVGEQAFYSGKSWRAMIF